MNPPKLKAVYRLDSIPLSATYWTKEGYLKDEPIVTSVGIFEYLNQDGSKRRELRLPEEVFDPASLASYEGKPIIITHNAGEVDKNNVQREHIGTILSPGIQDGNDVRAKIVIHNTDAMKRSGMRELSLGYSLDLDERPGTWNGQPYDAIQRNIRINHLALVQNARAGDQARLNIDSRDTTKGVKVMANTRKDGGPLTPEEMEKAIAEFKARKAARSGAGAPAADGGDPQVHRGAVLPGAGAGRDLLSDPHPYRSSKVSVVVSPLGPPRVTASTTSYVPYSFSGSWDSSTRSPGAAEKAPERITSVWRAPSRDFSIW